MLRWVGEAETCLTIKPHTLHNDPQLGGISQIQSFFLMSKEFLFPVRHLSPWDLYQRDKPLKPLVWKSNRVISRRPVSVGNGQSALLVCRFSCLGPSTKRKSLKNT